MKIADLAVGMRVRLIGGRRQGSVVTVDWGRRMVGVYLDGADPLRSCIRVPCRDVVAVVEGK